MGLADLHIHTIHSYDATSTVASVLKHAADNTSLDVIAITDHDEINGALEALELAPTYGIEVVPGCEVTTAEGHLLALYIQRRIPAGRPLAETVLRVGELGGICVLPHPLSKETCGAQENVIRAALQDPRVASILVGMETFNAGLVFPGRNAAALQLALTLEIAHVGNSDAHILQIIGQGATRFNGRTAHDLRQALLAKTTQAVRNRLASPVGLLAVWFQYFLLRKAGWVTWNSSPAAPLELCHVSRIARFSPGSSPAQP